MSRRPAALLLPALCLALAGCAPDTPRQAAVRASVEQVALPALQRWQTASRELQSEGQRFCRQQGELATVQQRWREAHRAWGALQPLWLGPLAEDSRTLQVQYWPDKKNLVAHQVEARLAEGSAAPLADASTALKGLSAAEYLLFDPARQPRDAATREAVCPLLLGILEYQGMLAGSVRSAWRNGGPGFAGQLLKTPNPQFADEQEALAALLRAQLSGLELMKQKLQLPLGGESGIPQPYQAEAWRSQNALPALREGLITLRALWREGGLRGLAAGQIPESAAKVDQAQVAAIAQLDALTQPLDQLLSTPSGRTRLFALQDQLNTLIREYEHGVAPALGVQIGFNANDGD